MSRHLPGRVLSDDVTDLDGNPAIMIEALPIHSGAQVRIVFESVGRGYPQGLFIATEGSMRTDGASARAFTLWRDSSPPEIRIDVLESDGALVFYNIWHEGMSAGFESQAYTSGMVREDLDDGWVRYACRDYGLEPEFISVVFRIRVDM